MDLAEAAKRVQLECLWTRTRQAARLLSRIYDDYLLPTGLQGSQFSVLVGITRFGERGATISKLADKLVMDRTTLTRIIGPLEKDGFVRVARSSEDARSKVLLLTRKGEAVLRAGLPLWERAQHDVRSRLGERHATHLLAELDVVLGRLDD